MIAKVEREVCTDISDNKVLAQRLMDDALLEKEDPGETRCEYLLHLNNGYTGDRRVKVTLIVEDA